MKVSGNRRINCYLHYTTH